MELAKILKLKVGNKIKINDKEYTIKEKSSHKAKDKYHSDATRYELGNDFVLEIEWEKPHFFQLVKKKGIIFETTSSKNIPIKKIQIK